MFLLASQLRLFTFCFGWKGKMFVMTLRFSTSFSNDSRKRHWRDRSIPVLTLKCANDAERVKIHLALQGFLRLFTIYFNQHKNKEWRFVSVLPSFCDIILAIIWRFYRLTCHRLALPRIFEFYSIDLSLSSPPEFFEALYDLF